MAKRESRSVRLDGALMNYAPENELGVVLLFSQIAKKYRIRVDRIQAAFPDCLAYRTIGGREEKLRIEFEYRSKSFRAHRHDAKKCDIIVCWEHDWPDVPDHLQVIELRREFGLGFNVWIAPVGDPHVEILASHDYQSDWSVPARAHKDDLVVFYRTSPHMQIADVFRISDDVYSARVSKRRDGAWHPKRDHFAPLRRVCTLDAPIFYADLKRHRVLSTAGFVRGQMRRRCSVSEYWPYLYELILDRNPRLRGRLGKYDPSRLEKWK